MRIVLVDREEFMTRRRAVAALAGKDRVEESTKAAIAAGDGPYVSIGSNNFVWECPGCGHVYGGMLGPEPVSGWEDPRWVLTGTDHVPTLTPSLGCRGWRNGACPTGHWWLRDGELVPA